MNKFSGLIAAGVLGISSLGLAPIAQAGGSSFSITYSFNDYDDRYLPQYSSHRHHKKHSKYRHHARPKHCNHKHYRQHNRHYGKWSSARIQHRGHHDYRGYGHAQHNNRVRAYPGRVAQHPERGDRVRAHDRDHNGDGRNGRRDGPVRYTYRN